MKALIVFFISLGSLLMSLAVWSGGEQGHVEGSAIDDIKSVVSRYSSSKGVELEIEKTVELVLLGETTKSTGKIQLAGGSLRVELGEPDNSLIVFNDKEIWMVSPTPKELGGKLQVSKIVSKDMQKQARAPLALLLAKESAWDQFEVKKQKRHDSRLEATLAPRKSKSFADLSQVKVNLNLADKTLHELVIVDEIENETKIKVLEARFDRKIAKKNFNYVPPENSEVTVYE